MPVPGIIAIRGGGWRSGDKNGFGTIAASLAAHGFAVASREYRVLPDVRFPDPVYDCKAAVRWMRAEGAGGHAGVSSRVQAVVAMAPMVDFAALARARDGAALNSLFDGHLDLARQLSPVTHLDKDSAQILLIHSDADKSVPFAQSTEMLDLYRKAGVPAELVTIQGAPHAFWNSDRWFPEVIEKSAKFFHAVLDRAGI